MRVQHTYSIYVYVQVHTGTLTHTPFLTHNFKLSGYSFFGLTFDQFTSATETLNSLVSNNERLL